MSDEIVIDPNTGLPVEQPIPELIPVLTDVVQPVAEATVVDTVNPHTLKALLLILGHDIEADWEHIVALAKKI